MKNKAINKEPNLAEKPRTKDVLIDENIHFNDLLLSDKTLKGLKACGFIKPSPIQKKAIPFGKCGFDLIIQAKSGTGKTGVFSVIALEMLEENLEKLQVLILAPTREIAVQIRDVISGIGKNAKGMTVEVFIGGLSLEEDKKKLKKCQIAVGSPGRVKHLIAAGLMKLDAVRLFVLDEADKLMEDNFRQDISSIYLNLPEVKQMIAASATFPPELEDFVTLYMTNPMRVSPGRETFLLGIRQFISIVPSHLSVFIQMKRKLSEVCRILSSVPFKQCLIFSNYQSRAESICNELNKKGWPSIYISGSLNQAARLKAMSSLKEFRCRVLLSTDLTSRGIDAENVNLIINLDLPSDGATYMHRIGRAGRFGSYGLAITIVQSGEELNNFRQMLGKLGCGNSQIFLFPKEAVEFDIWKAKDEDLENISIIGEELLPNSIEVKNNSESQVEEEKKMESKDLWKELTCSLVQLEKPQISDYDGLVKSCLDFKCQEKNENIQSENHFNFKDFSEQLKSLVICLENNIWKEHRKKIEWAGELSEVEKQSTLVSSELLNENKNKGNGAFPKWEEIKKQDIGNKFNEFSEEYSDAESTEHDYCDNDYVEDDNDINLNNKQLFDCELSEDCDEKTPVNSFYLKKWYSMWYSQLYAIRYYGNYLKYIYYLNEMQNLR